MSKIEQTIEKIIADAESVRHPLRPLLCFILWFLGTTTATSLIAFFSSLRPDLDTQIHQPLFIAEITALSLLIITTTVSAIYLSYPDLRQRPWVIYIPALPFLIYALLMLYRGMNPEMTYVLPEDLHNGINCSLCITLYSLLPGCLMFYLLRRNATACPRFLGALSLLLAGSIGLFALKFLEGNDSVLHMIKWHLTPVVIIGVLGIFLGKKFLSW